VGSGSEASNIPISGAVTFTFVPLTIVTATLPDTTLEVQPEGRPDGDLVIRIPVPDRELFERQYPGFIQAATGNGLSVTLHRTNVPTAPVTLSGFNAAYDGAAKDYVLVVPASRMAPPALVLRDLAGTLDVYVRGGGSPIKASTPLTVTLKTLPPLPAVSFAPPALAFTQGQAAEPLAVMVPDAGKPALESRGVLGRLGECRVVLRTSSLPDLILETRPPEGSVLSFTVERPALTASASALLAAQTARVQLRCPGHSEVATMDAAGELRFTGTP
jgi:hypothetical protein